MEKRNNNLQKLVYLAVLIAILFLLEITGLGMIKTAALEMTILQVPVLVGAILLGPASGAFLGGVFGFISFWECLSGKSAFGTVLLGINPYYTFIVCVVTRVLMGWLCGLIFKSMRSAMSTRKGQGRVIPFVAAGLSGALLNTVFFMTALILCFGNTDFIRGFQGDMALFPFLIAFVGLQGLIEAVICCFIGAAVSRAAYRLVNRQI